MLLQYTDPSTKAALRLYISESSIDNNCLKGEQNSMLSIAWNKGEAQTITIDSAKITLEADTIIPLLTRERYEFSNPEQIVLWQFNRDFYCVLDHDKEVSCAGFIFYNHQDAMSIKLDEAHNIKLQNLLEVFIDEFNEADIQGEMLRMLLKRLVIIVTRLSKVQYLSNEIDDQETDLMRAYNILVEEHYKTYHQVKDYANLLNKSPKTLSNIFAKCEGPTPLQIIRNRIMQEAKRLLLYSDKSTKEIAFELGFDDPANFSRLFKNVEGVSPSHYKQAI